MNNLMGTTPTALAFRSNYREVYANVCDAVFHHRLELHHRLTYRVDRVISSTCIDELAPAWDERVDDHVKSTAVQQIGSIMRNPRL